MSDLRLIRIQPNACFHKYKKSKLSIQRERKTGLPKERDGKWSRKYGNSPTWTFKSRIQTCNLSVSSKTLFRLSYRCSTQERKGTWIQQCQKLMEFGLPASIVFKCIWRMLLQTWCNVSIYEKCFCCCAMGMEQTEESREIKLLSFLCIHHYEKKWIEYLQIQNFISDSF